MSLMRASSESTGKSPLAIFGPDATGEKVANQLVAGLMRQTRLAVEEEEVLPDERLMINIGGVRYETWSSTLERIPGTRLAILARLGESDENFDKKTGEFFFDRHPRAFETILNYYRTEELHIDHSMCGNVLQKEFQYWGIEEMDIEACCWAEYSRFTEHKQTLRELDDTFAFVETELWAETSKWKRFADRIWLFLEDPSSSRWAKVYAVVSMLFVILSIGTFVLETHKMFQVDGHGRPMREVVPDKPTALSGSSSCCCEPKLNVNNTEITVETHPVLVGIDYACIIFFVLEYTIRLAFAPNKCKFLKTPLNIVDLICIIPHLIAICLKAAKINNAANVLKTVMMLRIIRVLRVFKLMKHYGAFKILAYTIKVSTKELMLMVAFLMSGVLMFASIIHYAEKDNFPDIPIAIWWALVTMTTVGYGDKYPVSMAGYMVGCVCVICGVLVIAFTVPIVVNNFSLYYSHAQTRVKLPKTRKHMVRKKLLGALNKNKPKPKRAFVAAKDYTQFTESPRSPDPKELNVNNFMNNFNQKDEKPSKPKMAVVTHGLESGTMTPVENNPGYAPSSLYEAETKQILDNMAGADQKLEEERRRQEQLIQQKREQRAKGRPNVN